MSKLLFTLVLLPVLASAEAPRPEQIFAEAKTICERDNGALWGHSLCGPIVLFEPRTRAVTANAPDKEDQLKPAGALWTGTLPMSVNAANTAINWAGVHWTMLVLPLPDDEHERGVVLAHELFHRIQDEVGVKVPIGNPANAHLDSRDGRYWLRLEMRALARALQSSDDARKQALRDALAFRAQRRALAANATVEETSLELNEGLAEYTGQALDTTELPAKYNRIASRLGPMRESYVRSFAYQTGPAYGLLLDALRPGWRKEISAERGGFSGLLTETVGTAKLDIVARAAAYDGAAIKTEEAARAKAIAERRAKYQAALVDGATLTFIHGTKMSIGFNPSNLVTFGEHGTVYPTARLSDEWGVVEVSDGMLLAANWRRSTVAAPSREVCEEAAKRTAQSEKMQIEGPGWKLTLAAGWRFAAGARKGDWTVQRAE